jgi:methionyl-tRNA formyltransferase
MYKILLLGSGDFSRGVLEGILASEHQLVAFFPWEIRFKPDLKTRIKRRFIEDNISVLERYQIPLLQLQSANSPAFHEAVKELSPDIMMVAGWGEILKPDTIRLPKVACVIEVLTLLLPYCVKMKAKQGLHFMI